MNYFVYLHEILTKVNVLARLLVQESMNSNLLN